MYYVTVKVESSPSFQYLANGGTVYETYTAAEEEAGRLVNQGYDALILEPIARVEQVPNYRVVRLPERA